MQVAAHEQRRIDFSNLTDCSSHCHGPLNLMRDKRPIVSQLIELEIRNNSKLKSTILSNQRILFKIWSRYGFQKWAKHFKRVDDSEI